MKTRCIWCGNSFDKEEIIDWNIHSNSIHEHCPDCNMQGFLVEESEE